MSNSTTADWSEEGRIKYRELISSILKCFGTDEYTFFREWIDEISSPREREMVRDQMTIACELGYLQDHEKTQDLWTRLERRRMDVLEVLPSSLAQSLAQTGQESRKGMDQ